MTALEWAVVSTHSRLKAAGLVVLALMSLIEFQHTAA